MPRVANPVGMCNPLCVRGAIDHAAFRREGAVHVCTTDEMAKGEAGALFLITKPFETDTVKASISQAMFLRLQ